MLQDTVHRGKPYDKGSVRYKQITQKLATFVASSNISNGIVEDEEFRALLAQLDDRYRVPGRTVINHEMVGFFTGAVNAHSKLLLLESQTLTEPTEHTLVCTSHDRVATG